MPRDEDTVNLDGNFLDRIPQDIRETFTDRQISAVNQAFTRTGHGIDIRVSLPLPGADATWCCSWARSGDPGNDGVWNGYDNRSLRR